MSRIRLSREHIKILGEMVSFDLGDPDLMDKVQSEVRGRLS
jgi:hypothetical protein